MKKLKLKIALKLIRFGIYVYESNIGMQWDKEDFANVEKLWRWHDQLQAELK